MRTHDSHVTDDGLTEAITGSPAMVDPATESRTKGSLATERLTGGSVPAASAPNVRVPPWDAWCAVGTQDTGEILHADDTKDVGDILETGDVRDLGSLQDAGDVRNTGRAAEAATDAKEARAAVRRPGRPRSERAEHAIIDAAIEALGEYGIDGVRCEDVAARAGVGKATLYRRWAGKEDLLIAAFAAMKHPLPAPRGESTREDLIALLKVVAADADDPRFAQQYALLHGAGERYPRLVARYREQIIEPRRELVREVLRRGVQDGELRPDINVEVAMLLLTGAVLARGKHDPAPAAPGFVESAVDEMLVGLAPR